MQGKKNILNKRVISVLAVVLILLTATVSVVANPAEKIIDNSKELFKQIQLFADSITIISVEYVEPIKIKELVYGAIRGMMKTLDGYSQFLDPDSFKEITAETQGEFGGIGIEVGVRDDVLTVIAPIEGTPAEKAGIQSGDKIVKINDKITRDMSLDDAVKTLRGDIGTDVKITVIRETADKLLDFNITRAIVKVQSIKEAKIIEPGIGYIRLAEFQVRTAKDLKTQIKELEKQGMKALAIDIRNNPGGLLDASIDVSELFLDEGKMIVYTEGRNPAMKMEFKAKTKSDFENLALVLIINKGSASAAEIFAGAVKDNKRGLLIGATTFGKGSVQTVIPLGDESALRLTTAAYYTPSGKNLMDKGVEPDIVVEIEEPMEKKDPDKEEKAKVFDKIEVSGKEKQDKEEEKDNQIQAAVNMLKGVLILQDREDGVREQISRKITLK